MANTASAATAEAGKLRGEISNKEAEIAQYESQKESNQAKIERLEVVKSYLTDMKDCREEDPASIKKTAEDTYEAVWVGSEYVGVKALALNGLHTDYKAYLKKVGGILDDVCDEITRLENKSREADGWIGSLCNAINSLGNELEKLFN